MTKNNTSISQIINLLSELVVFNQYDFNQFLSRLIKIITQIIPADSCFIYFYDRQAKHLILVGSKKPHEEEMGNIVMSEGEGITGWVVQHHKTVAIEEKAYKDPRFKFFEQLPEDKYESFLSVPIIDELGVIGVVNIQNRLPYQFTSEQIALIESIVKIISSAFSKTLLDRKVNSLENKLEERKLVEKAKGIIMNIRNMTEGQAFSFMRTESMNKRKSMKEIAEAIILVFPLDNK